MIAVIQCAAKKPGLRPVWCGHGSSLERCRIALSTNPDTVDAMPLKTTARMNFSAPRSTNSFPKISSAKLLEIRVSESTVVR